MDYKIFKLATGFILPETQQPLHNELKSYIHREHVPEINPLKGMEIINYPLNELSKITGKEPYSYENINMYLTGDGTNNNGSEFISSLISKNTKLNININFPIMPTYNSYILCISKLLGKPNDWMIRPATVISKNKIIYDWRINEHSFQMGETEDAEFLEQYDKGEKVMARLGLAFNKINDKQHESITQNVKDVTSEFSKRINK